MQIGIPREIKPWEGRVALLPSAVRELVADGHVVHVEQGAGAHSGHADAQYLAAGASLCADAASLYAASELVVKVKEPVAGDLAHLRSDHLLFCYLHLAALPELTRKLQDIGLTAVAFETVEEDGRLPLLAPMSEIAGRVAVQAGARLLHAGEGGKGLLLGGVTGTARGRVTVLGAGSAGTAAARVAHSLGAELTVFDISSEALGRIARDIPGASTCFASEADISAALPGTDLLVGAVLVPGARAPRVVSRDMVRSMEAGSVIVDIAIDQGGCIETIRPTDYTQPTYQQDDIIHMGVTNLPGAVPRTASQALSGAILPWVAMLAEGRLDTVPALRAGINVRGGELVHPGVRKAME